MICPHGYDEGMVERSATPDEVDEGCEFGIAFDPCPGCRAKATEVLLGVPDFDGWEHQAVQGQGPPA